MFHMRTPAQQRNAASRKARRSRKEMDRARAELMPSAESLRLRLDDLVAQFDALPMTSRARGMLATRIRTVEAALDALDDSWKAK